MLSWLATELLPCVCVCVAQEEASSSKRAIKRAIRDCVFVKFNEAWRWLRLPFRHYMLCTPVDHSKPPSPPAPSDVSFSLPPMAVPRPRLPHLPLSTVRNLHFPLLEIDEMRNRAVSSRSAQPALADAGPHRGSGRERSRGGFTARGFRGPSRWRRHTCRCLARERRR